MNLLVLAHRQRLDALFSRVSSFSSPADQSEWSRYLCVLVSGFVEESLRVLLEEYSKNHASQIIQSFVSSELKEITNCKAGKITSILRKFDPAWETNFLNEIQTNSRVVDEIKNSIDSVITNRHLIAHGKSVGINYSTISNYYSNVKRAVAILEAIIR
jgi:hypothetical protein